MTTSKRTRSSGSDRGLEVTAGSINGVGSPFHPFVESTIADGGPDFYQLEPIDELVRAGRSTEEGCMIRRSAEPHRTALDLQDVVNATASPGNNPVRASARPLRLFPWATLAAFESLAPRSPRRSSPVAWRSPVRSSRRAIRLTSCLEPGRLICPAARMVFGTPVALGAELGAGNLLVASLAASYQPFARQLRRKVHPFLRVSLTAVSSSPYSAECVGIGGGLAYWPRSRRVGLRVEAAKLWPALDEDPSPPGETFVPRLWTLRAGVAFGW